MMELYLFALFVSVILFFITSFAFKKAGIVDKPDGIRKIHKGDIPFGGGLALFGSFSIIMLLFPDYSLSFKGSLSAMANIWLISIIILFLGLWDDVKPLPTSARLIVQIFASWLVIIITDVYVRDLGNLFGWQNIYIDQLGIPLTIFMVVGVCNAFNMLDGMDGLVGFVLLITSAAIAVIASYNGTYGALFLGTLVISIFLLFNLGLLGRKRKIFLGDSGSMWLGFMAAWSLVVLSQNENMLFPPVTALWLILLPLIDAMSTFINRIWNSKSMFTGDRSHIHHMLLDSGLEKWKVLLIFLLISILSSSFAVFSVMYNISEYFQFYGFLTIWFMYFLLIKFPLIKKLDS